jgi:outer membrane protein OmpA-like peptidoglycan-associated protein
VTLRRYWEAVLRFVVPVVTIGLLLVSCPEVLRGIRPFAPAQATPEPPVKPQPPTRPLQPVVTPPPGPQPPPVQIALPEIRFAFDQDALSEQSKRTLDANLVSLRKQGSPPVTIVGHCDARGTVEYNHGLAERRAATAKKYLVERGYDERRLHLEAVGTLKPRCRDPRERCWEQNRRAEFLALP